jgi:hypothetical protein
MFLGFNIPNTFNPVSIYNVCVIKKKEKDTHHFIGNLSNGVGVVHPFPVIRERGPDVHGRFLIPVGQEVVEAVVGQSLDCWCRAVPSCK